MNNTHKSGTVLAVKTFPRVLYVTQLVLAGILGFAVKSGITTGTGNIPAYILFGIAIGWLIVSPIKAKTIVYEDSIEVRTIFGVKTASRKKVRYFRGGLLGPVVVLVDGTKIQAIAPIPKDCWVERRPVPYNPPR